MSTRNWFLVLQTYVFAFVFAVLFPVLVISLFSKQAGYGHWGPSSAFLSQCSTLVPNTVVRATCKVNGKPPILRSRSPLTPWPIDLKFDTGDYIDDRKPLAKNCKKIGPAGPPRSTGEMRGSIWVIFYFYGISCTPLEITILYGSTPFLRQMTCFGGVDFLGGLIVRVKIFPLQHPKKPQLWVHFWKRFTMGTLQSKLPLIIIVAPWKLYSE